MAARFVETRPISLTYNCPPIGYFALEQDGGRPVTWDHCREQFLGKMSSNMTGMYFCHQENKSEDVAGFVSKFEEVTGMFSTEKPRSFFGRTDRPNIIWIQPCQFWLGCLIKKSLFTLVCRCSLNYDLSRDNFDQCLFGDHPECKLVRETRVAVLRFMFGFTRFKGEIPPSAISAGSTLIRHGWHSEFANCGAREAKSKLGLPVEADILNGFGFDFIWN